MPVREVALALGWVPVGEVALALGCLLDKVFGGFGRFWRAPGGFGGFWRVWRVFGVFGGFWRVVRQDKFHTCGGPRRRPGLGEGRGRRISALQAHCLVDDRSDIINECTQLGIKTIRSEGRSDKELCWIAEIEDWLRLEGIKYILHARRPVQLRADQYYPPFGYTPSVCPRRLPSVFCPFAFCLLSLVQCCFCSQS